MRPASAAGPSFVDITWFSISNVYYEIGPLKIVTDGYITRIPQSAFFGGGGGLANTRQPFKPDVAGVTRVMNALGGPSSVNLLLTGHSHFDHSFDTAHVVDAHRRAHHRIEDDVPAGDGGEGPRRSLPRGFRPRGRSSSPTASR